MLVFCGVYYTVVLLIMLSTVTDWFKWNILFVKLTEITCESLESIRKTVENYEPISTVLHQFSEKSVFEFMGSIDSKNISLD